MKDPELVRENKSTVRGLLLGCTGRKFQGHGYESTKGMLETLKIFARVNCDGFISRYPGVCPEFNRLYQESMCELENPIRRMGLRNEWGESYTKLSKEVLELREQNRA